jgi:hypothetical protein
MFINKKSNPIGYWLFDTKFFVYLIIKKTDSKSMESVFY